MLVFFLQKTPWIYIITTLSLTHKCKLVLTSTGRYKVNQIPNIFGLKFTNVIAAFSPQCSWDNYVDGLWSNYLKTLEHYCHIHIDLNLWITIISVGPISIRCRLIKTWSNQIKCLQNSPAPSLSDFCKLCRRSQHASLKSRKTGCKSSAQTSLVQQLNAAA